MLHSWFVACVCMCARYPCVKRQTHDVTGVAGSSEMYAFRGCEATTGEGSISVLQVKFMNCYCKNCRNSLRCPYVQEFGSWGDFTLSKVDMGAGSRMALRDERCQICHSPDPHSPSAMLLCDHCNMGWHMACLPVPVTEVPCGDWFCPYCEQDSDLDDHMQ